MKSTLIFIVGLLLITSASYASAGFFDFLKPFFGEQAPRLGATIAQTIQGGTGTSTAPGNDSILLGNADKTYNVKTLTAGSNVTFSETGNTLTISSTGGTGGDFAWTPLYSGAINATSTTLGFLNGFISSGASSTISDALKLTNTLNCNTLDTDANGLLSCGTDEGGTGVPNLIYRTLGTTKFYTASSSATDNNVWHFNNGFVSSASSSIAGDLRLDGTLLGASTFTLTGSGTSTLSNGLSVGTGGLLTSGGLTITGGTLLNTDTSTSTFSGGLFANDLKINFPSCNSANKLITDASGSITCALEALDGAYTGTYDGNNFAGGAIGAGELLYGGSAGSLSELGVGTRGNVLMFGTGAFPIWQATTTLVWEGDTATSTITNAGLSVGGGGLASSKGISLSGGIFNSAVTSSSTFAGGLTLGVSAGGLSIGSNRLNVFNNGNILFGTSTIVSTATSSPQVLISTPFAVDSGHNGTTTIQIGDVGNKSCLKIRDVDNGAWSYCRVKSGVMTCSATSCE